MAELVKDQLSLQNIFVLTKEIAQQAPSYQVYFNQEAFQQVLPEYILWLELSLIERLRPSVSG